MKTGEVPWNLVDGLARSLAQQRVSANLVRQAAAYSSRYPQTNELKSWLERLVKLGATFASGREDVTTQERQKFQETLAPLLEKYPNLDWTQVLSWVARVMLYYMPQKTQAPGTARRNR